MCIFAVSVLASAGLFLWTPGAGEKTYDLQTIEALALVNSPVLREASAEMDAARGAQMSARLWSDPNLAWRQGRGKSLETQESGREYSWEISQTLPWLGAYGAERRAASFGAEASAHKLQAARLEVLAGVRREFFRTLLEQENVLLLRESHEAAQKTHEKISLRAAVGEARETEKSRTHVEALRLENAVRRAETELFAAQRALDVLVGDRLGAEFRLEGSMDVPASLPPYSDALAHAIERNPEIRAAESSREQTEYLFRAARRRKVPDLSLSAFQESELDRDGYGAGFAFRIPLWNRNRGNVLAASAERDAADARLEQARLSLAAELKTAYRRMETEHRRALSYGQTLLEETKRAFSLTTLAYEQGESSLIEYLDALRVHVSAQQEALEAAYEFHLAKIEVEKLLGDFSDVSHE